MVARWMGQDIAKSETNKKAAPVTPGAAFLHPDLSG
jgi:hypothetical protein